MFVLNLSVSFLLALITAVRPYELPARDNVDLLRALYRRFKRAPLEFVIPPSRIVTDPRGETKVPRPNLELKV